MRRGRVEGLGRRGLKDEAAVAAVAAYGGEDPKLTGSKQMLDKLFKSLSLPIQVHTSIGSKQGVEVLLRLVGGHLPHKQPGHACHCLHHRGQERVINRFISAKPVQTTK